MAVKSSDCCGLSTAIVRLSLISTVPAPDANVDGGIVGHAPGVGVDDAAGVVAIDAGVDAAPLGIPRRAEAEGRGARASTRLTAPSGGRGRGLR